MISLIVRFEIKLSGHSSPDKRSLSIFRAVINLFRIKGAI
jgi:hypothetical protein